MDNTELKNDGTNSRAGKNDRTGWKKLSVLRCLN